MAKNSSTSSPSKPDAPVTMPRPRTAPSRERSTVPPRRSSLTGATSRSAPSSSAAITREVGEGTSALLWVALVLAALLAGCAPVLLSGFMPATYDYGPQALWLGGLMVLALLLCAASLTRRTPGERGVSPVGALLLLFLAWCGASVVGAVYRHDALLEIARLLGVVAWFFLARHLVRRVSGAGSLLIAASVAGGAYLALDALSNFFITAYPRQGGGFLNPNLFATWGAMLVPLGLALTLQLALMTRREVERETPNGGLWKWGALFSGLATFVIAGGLAVTSSKGGFLALLVALLVFGIAVLRARGRAVVTVLRTQAKIVVPVVAVLLVVGALVAAKTVLPRLQQARGTDDNSTMFRLYTWRGTWAMTQARPLLGWGAGAFPSAYPQFAITGDTRSAHQSWLQLASECGLLAPLLLLGAVGAAFVRGWRGLKTRADWPLVAGGFGATTALLAHGFTDDPWKVIATAALGTFALALLDGDDGVRAHEAPEPGATPQRKGSALALVPLAVCLAFAAWWTGRSASAVTLWSQADAQLAEGDSSFALPFATQAVETMPLSSRAQIVRGQCLAGDGDIAGARAALERASQLRPTSAEPPSLLAELLARDAPAETATIRSNFDRAVRLAPHDVDVLLERGAWLLSQKDARGWADFSKIVALADAPYGRYPALGDDVNLDFDRARLQLAARQPVAQRGRYLTRVLADVKRARGDAAMLFSVAEEANGHVGAVAKRKQKIDEIEQQADALKASE